MRTVLPEGEKVILEVKRHWVVLSTPLLALVGISFIWIIAMMSDSGFLRKFRMELFYGVIALVLYCWYCMQARQADIWIVTNLRVISESGVFTQESKESPLDKINNVQYKQTIAGRQMNYGDVEIQTAAEQGASIDQFVTSPKALHDAIVQAQQTLKDSERESFSGHRTSGPGTDEMECPFCAEIIKKKAKVCKHCGHNVTENDAPAAVAAPAPTGPQTSPGQPASFNKEPPAISPRGWMIKK